MKRLWIKLRCYLRKSYERLVGKLVPSRTQFASAFVVLNSGTYTGVVKALAFGVLAALTLVSCTPIPTLASTVTDVPAAERGQPAIENGLATSEAIAAVEGTYYFGDGKGVNCVLNLKPDNTFEFTWHGCMGEYDRNQGPYRMQGEMVVLSPTGTNSRDGFEGTPTQFYPVKWEDRLYLVADEDMLGFCHRVSRGWKGEKFNSRPDHYLRDWNRETELKDLESKPQVPELFESYLKDGFTAAVTFTESNETFRINKGLQDGVALRTRFLGTRGNWYVVTALEEKLSTLRRWNGDVGFPNVGDVLTPLD